MFSSFIHQNIKIEPASFKRIDTEIVVFLPDNGDELKKVFDGEHRLWIAILTRSFKDNIVMKKNKSLGFLVVEPEKPHFKYVPPKKEQKNKKEGVLLDTKEKDNSGDSLIDMILPMQVETLLIKLVKLHLE